MSPKKKFSNTYFGLSGLISSPCEEIQEAVRSIPEDRVLLETDSPHLAVDHEATIVLVGKINVHSLIWCIICFICLWRPIKEGQRQSMPVRTCKRNVLFICYFFLSIYTFLKMLSGILREVYEGPWLHFTNQQCSILYNDSCCYNT